MKTLISAIVVGMIALGSVAPAHANAPDSYVADCSFKDVVFMRNFCGLDGE